MTRPLLALATVAAIPGARRLGILFTPAEELCVHLADQRATATSVTRTTRTVMGAPTDRAR